MFAGIRDGIPAEQAQGIVAGSTSCHEGCRVDCGGNVVMIGWFVVGGRMMFLVFLLPPLFFAK